MSLVSWFSGSRPHRHSALNKSGPQLTYSRPSLEYLEERALLDATSGLLDGSSGNLALNSNYNLASNGVILPNPGAAIANGANPTHALNSSGLVAGGTAADAADAAPLAQGQPSAQFRLFAVNSQGEDYRLYQQSQGDILRNAYGFGSGSMPNAPWMPAAYNLGLGNHQFNYSSQSDFGLQSVPPYSYPRPGTIPLAQSEPWQKLDWDDGAVVQEPEPKEDQKPAFQQEQNPQENKPQTWLDDDAGETNEAVKTRREKVPADKQPLLDQAPQQESRIPDSLWLSSLGPIPLSALVVGLPGAAAEADGGEAGAEAPE